MISDWGDLQTVLSIAKGGSLSAAARELGLSQSTVSRRLQAIEQRLNDQIFLRRGAGDLVPTAAGAAMIAAAENMQAAFATVKQALAGDDAPIRIATCEVIAKALLVPTLSQWLTQPHRSVELSVFDDLFSLPDDAFDILVTPLESAPDEMVGQRIAGLAWGLFASPRYLSACPFAPGRSHLNGHRVIRSSGPLAHVAACRWFNDLGGEPVFSASSPAAQQEAAASGTGIALLPAALAINDARLVRIDFSGTPTSDVWMVTRRATAKQPRVAAFLSWSRRDIAHQTIRRQSPTGAIRKADVA